MQLKMMLAIFGSVFLAELGDKTQIATVCFASDANCSKLDVFLASSAALICSSFIAVMAGSVLNRVISPQLLKIIAGTGFVIIGFFFVWEGIKN